MRELLRIHIPISQTGMIGLALAEPAVVHDEAFYADACGLFGERHLTRLIHVESRCLPRVVEHRPQLRRGVMREYGIDFEAMHQARRTSDPVSRVAAVEGWRREG